MVTWRHSEQRILSVSGARFCSRYLVLYLAKMSGPSDAVVPTQCFDSLIEDVVIHGFVALNISIGARLRLFDALADACASGPVTSTQLAEHTGLKERFGSRPAASSAFRVR